MFGVAGRKVRRFATLHQASKNYHDSGAGEFSTEFDHLKTVRHSPNSALSECNGTGRCATSKAPRLVPLHHRACNAQMTPGLFSPTDETRGSGQPQQFSASVAAAPAFKNSLRPRRWYCSSLAPNRPMMQKLIHMFRSTCRRRQNNDFGHRCS